MLQSASKGTPLVVRASAEGATLGPAMVLDVVVDQQGAPVMVLAGTRVTSTIAP